MEFTYLTGLLVGISGMAIIDYRYRLAFFIERRRTLLTIGCALLIFIVWDIAGITLGIFLHGNSPFSLPFRIFPEFPVEELVFLTLLCYCALVLYRGAIKLWPRT